MRTYSKRAKKFLPNLLSLSRILWGVLFFLSFPRNTLLTTVLALGLITLSLTTDYLDGKMARAGNSVSLLGKWIDPFADCTFFFFAYLSFHKVQLMPLLLLLLFAGRELLMYAVIRPLCMVKKIDPGAKAAGKIKTVFQIVGSIGIILLTLLYQLRWLPFPSLRAVATSILILLVGVSLASLYWYIRPLISAAPGDRA